MPAHAQLRQHIISALMLGIYRVGEQLPTVDEMTSDTGLARATVARVYRELARDRALDTTVRTAGTIVLAAPPEIRLEYAMQILGEGFSRLRRLGLTTAEVSTACDELFALWPKVEPLENS